MRQIILDTETTGLEPSDGHRIIEIGALEMVERRLTGRSFHQYLNPERAVDSGAVQVHGLTDDFLRDKPLFAQVADDLIDFIRDAELVIHNAPFDVGFLDAELARIDPELKIAGIADVLDTLVLAVELHPGQRNSLDALCKRYDVDNSNRTLHGALLDAELLAEVYLAMTGGQVDLALELGTPGETGAAMGIADLDLSRLRVAVAGAEEQASHQRRLAHIEQTSGQCLWLRQENAVEKPR